MREDPIIVEDWRPGRASTRILYPISLFDTLIPPLTMLIAVGFALIHNKLETAFMFTIFVFVYILLAFLIPQTIRGLQERVLEFISLVVFLALFSPALFNDIYFQISIAILVFFKFFAMVVMLQLHQLTDEIFLPKTQDVQTRLENAIANLDVTDYKLDWEDIIKSRDSIIKRSLTSMIPVIVLAILFFIPLQFGNIVLKRLVQFAGVIFIFSTAVMILYILKIWNQQKSRSKKKKKEK